MDKDRLIESLLSEVHALSGEVRRLTARVEELERQNNALLEENAALRHENTLLREGVDDLKSRLSGNSHNSYRPPSSDGYRKGNSKPVFDRKKGGKQCGQEGHGGHTLRQGEESCRKADGQENTGDGFCLQQRGALH